MFNLHTGKLYDLENFESKIAAKGMNLQIHYNTNKMDMNLEELMYEMKNSGKFSIPLEKLDQEVVGYLNSF